MIVKMQKITLLVGARHREAALAKLRKLGVLHVHYVQNPSSEDIHPVEAEAAHVDRALQIIGEGKEPQKNLAPKQVPAHVKEILSVVQEKEKLFGELEELRAQHRWFENWGSVSFASLQELRKAGVVVRFYVADKNALKDLPADKAIQVVKENQRTVYLAFFTVSADDRLDFREEQMPEVELSSLKAKIKEIEKEIARIERALTSFSRLRKSLLAYRADVDKRLEFSKVMHSMGEEEEIAYLQGFCPAECAPEIRKTAGREGWAYVIQDPDDPNEVPTLLRNPKWLRIIGPLFKFMGTMPGYNEHDISFWFLMFFSVFFALLIGDAGYGLVFLSLTLLFSRKMRNAPREPFRLMYVLSGATIIWGLISGNWFGYEKIGQLPFLNLFIVDQVSSFAANNQMFMMYLCFVIGILHLTVAHAIIAFRYINSLAALGQLGWIAILWVLFFVAGSLVLERPLPGFTMILFALGILLALLFSNPQKNLLKGMALSLSDLPLSIISSFSDVVSYLRLFAVGYATVIVASSFNSMAIEFGFGSLMSGFVAAFVLFLGHSLNIILGLMAVVVHGIRLNMLEFSGQLNMQWSGREYRPFKE